MKLHWKEVIAVNIFSTVYFSNNKHPNQKLFFISFIFLNLCIYFLEANYFTILYWFCHTLTWISHGCTCVPHPEPPSHLPPHPIPLDLSQCTSFECPLSCIELGLVIYFTYGNIHVSMLFSQIFLPSPSPRVQKSVLYMSLFRCLAYRVILPSF